MALSHETALVAAWSALGVAAVAVLSCTSGTDARPTTLPIPNRPTESKYDGLELVRSIPGHIEGRALLDGVPVANFGVVVGLTGSVPPPPILFERSDGLFMVRGINPGLWDVTIVGVGFEPYTISGLRIGPGQPIVLGDVPLLSGRSIRGRVTDAFGTPIGGSIVSVVHDPSQPPNPRDVLPELLRGNYYAVTDSNGVYEISGMYSRREYRQIIAENGSRERKSLPRVLLDADNIVNLSLLPVGRLDGRISSPNEAWVVVARSVSSQRSWFMAKPDSQGSFDFGAVPEGAYEMSLFPMSHAMARPKSYSKQRISIVANMTSTVVLSSP